MQDPNEDTEWNDILRAHGILPPKQGPTEDDIFEELDQSIRAKTDKKLDEKTLEELDELEDDEDERVLLEYRKKRIAELKYQASRAKFGYFKQISKPDFIREVTEASREDWVVVHLFKDFIPACKLLNAHLDTLASRHPATKFVKIIGDQCIPNYPDHNLPTLLIYGEGDMKAQLVGIQKLGGMRMTLEDLEKYFVSVGAIESISRESGKDEESPALQKSIYKSRPATSALSDDDEDD